MDRIDQLIAAAETPTSLAPAPRDPSRDRIDDLITQAESAPQPAPSAEFVMPPAESRSWAADVGVALEAGSLDAAKALITLDRNLTGIDPQRRAVAQQAIDFANTRTAEPDLGPSLEASQSGWRRALYGGVRSMPLNALSAAVSTLNPTVGMAFTAGLYGGPQYDDFMAQAIPALMAQGYSKSQAEDLSRWPALRSAFYEGGLEAVFNRLEMGFSGLAPVARLEARLARLPLAARTATRFAGAVGTEALAEEPLQNALSAYEAQRLGVPGSDPLDAALQSIGPAAVGSLPFALFGAGTSHIAGFQERAAKRQYLESLVPTLQPVTPAPVANASEPSAPSAPSSSPATDPLTTAYDLLASLEAQGLPAEELTQARAENQWSPEDFLAAVQAAHQRALTSPGGAAPAPVVVTGTDPATPQEPPVATSPAAFVAQAQDLHDAPLPPPRAASAAEPSAPSSPLAELRARINAPVPVLTTPDGLFERDTAGTWYRLRRDPASGTTARQSEIRNDALIASLNDSHARSVTASIVSARDGRAPNELDTASLAAPRPVSTAAAPDPATIARLLRGATQGAVEPSATAPGARPTMPAPGAETLTTWLRTVGGLSLTRHDGAPVDHGTELAELLDSTGRRGRRLRNTSNSQSNTPDLLLQRAIERGFLPESATLDDFTAALESELRGTAYHYANTESTSAALLEAADNRLEERDWSSVPSPSAPSAADLEPVPFSRAPAAPAQLAEIARQVAPGLPIVIDQHGAAVDPSAYSRSSAADRQAILADQWFAFLGADNQIHLNACTITGSRLIPEFVRAQIQHETSHAGLRALGPRRRRALLRQTFAQLTYAERKALRERGYARAARTLGQDARRTLLADEAIAFGAEDLLAQKDPTWLERLLVALRQAARTLGLNLTLTATELRVLLAEGTRSLTTAAPATSQVNLSRARPDPTGQLDLFASTPSDGSASSAAAADVATDAPLFPSSTSAPTPSAPAAQVYDFGEKIGGARKDTARKLGPKPRPSADQELPDAEQPAWRKWWVIEPEIERQSYYSSTPPKPTGRYTLRYTRERYSRYRLSFATQAEALDAMPLAEAARTHDVTLDRHQPSKWAIARKVGDRKRPIVKTGFDSEEAAKRYLAQNAEQIINHKFAFPEVPWLESIQRTGPTERTGDATPQMFQETFRFRGGEFGLWNMGTEGQQALNHAYDALLDLARVLQIPPAALSLNGRLAIAFGARGHGGENSARAHYEPDKVVINLTKIRGAGSLAHEWLHALDYYLGGFQQWDKPGNISRNLADHYPTTDLRPAVDSAFKNIVHTMTAKTDQVALAPEAAARFHKRTEQYVADELNKLRDSMLQSYQYSRRKTPPTAEQLARWDQLSAQILKGDVGEIAWVPSPQARGRYSATGWYTYAPVNTLNDIYKDVLGRAFLRADGVASSLVPQIKEMLRTRDRLAAAAQGATEQRRLPTDYLQNSREIDQLRASDYWSTPKEMLARAFAAYVSDKLDAAQQRSHYLVYAADNSHYQLLNLKPYPEGDERTAINAAFDNLFQTIQTAPSPTAPGVPMLFSRPHGETSASESSPPLPFTTPPTSVPSVPAVPGPTQRTSKLATRIAPQPDTVVSPQAQARSQAEARYTVLADPQLASQASAAIAQAGGVEAAATQVRDTSNGWDDATRSAVAIQLMRLMQDRYNRLSSQGDRRGALMLDRNHAELLSWYTDWLRTAGRAVSYARQIFAIDQLQHLGPAGWEIFAQRQIAKARASQAPAETQSLIAQLLQALHQLSAEAAQNGATERAATAASRSTRTATGSLWQLYQRRIASQISAQVARSLTPGTTATPPPVQEFADRLASALRAQLEALVPAAPAVPAAAADLRQQLVAQTRDALANPDRYTEALRTVQAELRAKYADRPEILTALDAFLEAAKIPLNRSLIADIVRRELDIATLARQHYSQATRAGADLAADLASQIGLTPAQATELAKAIATEVHTATAAAKQKALDHIIAQAAKSKVRRAVKSAGQRLIELSNLGALDSEAAYTALQDKLGLPAYDPAFAAQVRARAERISQIQNPGRRLAEANLLAGDIAAYVREPIYNAIATRLANFRQLDQDGHAELRRALLDAWRLNLFSVTSFSLDIVSNAAELAAQRVEGAAYDLAHVLRTGRLTLPATSAFLYALRHRATHARSPLDARLEAAFGRTVSGETDIIAKSSRGAFPMGDRGTFSTRRTKFGKTLDAVVGTPLYLKGVADLAAKRLAAMAALYQEARTSADRQGLRGIAAEQYVNDYIADPPAHAIDTAIALGNAAGFNRNLSGFEEAFARNTFVRLFVTPFGRWPFQLFRWAAEMLGANPRLLKALRTRTLTPERLAGYLARMATGWGGLLLVASLFPPTDAPDEDKDRGYVDYKTLDSIGPDGSRTSLRVEPVSTAIFLASLLRGDRQAVLDSSRYASLPFSQVLLSTKGDFGGLLGSLFTNYQRALKTGNPEVALDEVANTLNRLIPGQALLGALESLINPTQQRGLGARLPGVSYLLEDEPSPTTGKPEIRYWQIGDRTSAPLPALSGVPLPFTSIAQDPVHQILSQNELLTYRGPRAPIAGIAPSDLTYRQRREWNRLLGEERQRVFQDFDYQQLRRDGHTRAQIREITQRLEAQAAAAARARLATQMPAN